MHFCGARREGSAGRWEAGQPRAGEDVQRREKEYRLYLLILVTALAVLTVLAALAALSVISMLGMFPYLLFSLCRTMRTTLSVAAFRCYSDAVLLRRA